MTQSNPTPSNKADHQRFERAPLYFDLALILLLNAAAIVVVFVPVASAAPRAIVGLLFMFFAPGYAVLAAVFPQKENMTNVERVILSLVVSLIVAGGVGLLLPYTPFGLRAEPLVVCLSSLTVVSTIVAYGRRSSLSSTRAFTISFHPVGGVRRVFSYHESIGNLDKMLVVVLILIIFTSLVATVYLVAIPFGGEPSTELYLLGSNGTAVGYPSELRIGEATSVIVGVTNHEQRPIDFTLVTTLNGTAGSSTLSSENLSLANNQNWEQTVSIRPDQTGTNLKLSFLLYGDNKTAPLQTAHLWVNVTT